MNQIDHILPPDDDSAEKDYYRPVIFEEFRKTYVSVYAAILIGAPLTALVFNPYVAGAIMVVERLNEKKNPHASPQELAIIAHDFLDRRWPQIKQEWPQPLRLNRAAQAMGMAKPAQSLAATMPSKLHSELRLAAIQTGLRYSFIGPLYAFGKKAVSHATPHP